MNEQPETKAGGISPVLILFLVSGLLGLGAAVAMLIVDNNRETVDRDALNSVVQQGGDWEADDFALPGLDGETVRLSDYAGQTVFLNFWRTDCPPCVREMPAFQEFTRQQAESGDAVVLAVNQGEDPEDVRAFLEEIGVTELPVLLDRDLEIEANYPINVLPTTYIISPDGMVEFTKYGEFDLEGMYLYLDEIAALDTRG